MTRSKTAAARRDDVEVADRDRVERAGVDRDRVHRSSCCADRRSASSRRSGARARMLAARPGRAAASRQKCLATTRAPGARRGRRAPRGAGARGAAGLGVRRVDDDDVERPGGGGVRAASQRERVAPGRSWPARPAEVGPREVGGDDRGRARVALDERRRGGAARQRLDPGRAAAGEQVEDARAAAGRGSRIANSVCLTRSAERPGARARGLEPDARGRSRR